jgi:hypothetical protein
MTMTPDQCFDEMAVALGVPKDTGYTDLLELVKGAMSSGLIGKVEKLTEENKKLKDTILGWQEKADFNLDDEKLQIPDGVKSSFRTLNDVYFNDESDWYSENYYEEMEGKYEEPEDIPTKHLHDCNYRHWRIVWEWMFDEE